jgi:hypothetical protein
MKGAGESSHWVDSARQLVKGLVLHTLQQGDDGYHTCGLRRMRTPKLLYWSF